jgi:hypothetical protein
MELILHFYDNPFKERLCRVETRSKKSNAIRTKLNSSNIRLHHARQGLEETVAIASDADELEVEVIAYKSSIPRVPRRHAVQ